MTDFMNLDNIHDSIFHHSLFSFGKEIRVCKVECLLLIGIFAINKSYQS